MPEVFNYEKLMLKIIENYEEVAEINGQDGDYDMYETQMANAKKLREGLQSFKENYTVTPHGSMSFLTEFFKIMKTEYGCDIDDLARCALPSYIRTKEREKETLEQELSNLEVFKTTLDALKE